MCRATGSPGKDDDMVKIFALLSLALAAAAALSANPVPAHDLDPAASLAGRP